MAEFTEVMRQTKRMCESYPDCTKCALNISTNKLSRMCHCFYAYNGVSVEVIEKIESIVMQWAAEHPEPKYPTWDEWFKKTFPDSEYTHCPCPNVFYRICDPCAYHGEVECYQCRNSPIPADIAVKLGIKPIGGTDNE